MAVSKKMNVTVFVNKLTQDKPTQSLCCFVRMFSTILSCFLSFSFCLCIGVTQAAKPSGAGGKAGGDGGGESAGLELSEGSELLVEEQGAVSKLIATEFSSLADMEVRKTLSLLVYLFVLNIFSTKCRQNV